MTFHFDIETDERRGKMNTNMHIAHTRLAKRIIFIIPLNDLSFTIGVRTSVRKGEVKLKLRPGGGVCYLKRTREGGG